VITGPLNHVEIETLWPLIADGMKRACERTGGNVTPSWLYQTCRTGDAMLFAIHDEAQFQAAFVGRFIHDQPEGSLFKFVALTGRGMKDWLPGLIVWARTWPRQFGVKKVVTDGSGAWARIPGFRVRVVTYEANVDG
jgi:hypothetical protein